MSNLDKTSKDLTRAPRGFNKDLWEADGSRLLPKVRKVLLKLAQAFWNEIEHGEARVRDVTLSGSLAGDRWSKDSDVDLHIIIEKGPSVDGDKLVSEYFRVRSRMWNSKHSLEIAGHPIELYVQDVVEPHYSSKVYSVLRDEWVRREEQEKYPSAEDIKKKAKPIAAEVLSLTKALKDNPTQNLLNSAEKLAERLRKLRQTGLEEAGESSVENLAYKALKRAGYMERLNDAKLAAFDEIYQKMFDV